MSGLTPERSDLIVMGSGRQEITVPPFVRLVHKTLLDGRYHVYTSPDVKGFHVAMETIAEAKREAIAVLDMLAKLDGVEKPDFAFVDEDRKAA